MKTDLNCDTDESFGRFQPPIDTDTVPQINSINVVCGLNDKHLHTAEIRKPLTKTSKFNHWKNYETRYHPQYHH